MASRAAICLLGAPCTSSSRISTSRLLSPLPSQAGEPEASHDPLGDGRRQQQLAPVSGAMKESTAA
jgi:hypothetical protein